MPRGDSIAPGSLVGAIRALYDAGHTATSGLRALRESGLGVTTQAWYRTWGETAAAVGNAGLLGAADPSSVLRGDQHTEWSAGTAGVFAYQVNVIVDDPMSATIGRAPYTVTSSVPLTPDEAIAQAADDMAANTGEGASGEGQKVHGGVLVGAYRMTGYNR